MTTVVPTLRNDDELGPLPDRPILVREGTQYPPTYKDVLMAPPPTPEDTPMASPPEQKSDYAQEVSSYDDADLRRYLNYTVSLYSCKYKDPLVTWGELIKKDYEHFKELLSTYVRIDTQTFNVLQSQLKPDDREEALHALRFYDTPEYLDYRKAAYLEYICNHKGRFNGKTWRFILENDYKYFMWAVQHTMGRHTKSFQILVECLRPDDIAAVKASKRKPAKIKRQNPCEMQDDEGEKNAAM